MPSPRAEPRAVHLAARPPFDGAGLLAHFAARLVPGVEELTGDGEYRRSLQLSTGPAVIGLTPDGSGVRCRVWGGSPEEAAPRVRLLFDLDMDPAAVMALLGDDPVIGELVRAQPGRRVAGAVDGAELAVRAVLGQQVSVAGAATVGARLAARYGEPVPGPVGGVVRLFPAPAALAAAEADELPMPRSRARALIALCSAVADGELDLAPGADPDAAEAALLALPGIGPWTASYVRLRALGDRDAFPAGDLGLRRALVRLGADERAAERWRPLRAYAAQHLWAAQ